jgi:hypothetical protein
MRIKKNIYTIHSQRYLIFVLFVVLSFLSPFNAQADTPSCNTDKNQVDKLIESKYIKYIGISVSKSKKWAKNYFKALRTPGELILAKHKKRFDANITVLFDNDITCIFSAKIRINGDYKDHLSSIPLVSSLDVKLLTGNINSIIKFKLFIPHTRGGDNEIFTATLMRELGFLAPRTYYVPAKLNGQSTVFMFQEKASKEFIEANNLREAPILEGDERFAFIKNKEFDDRFIMSRVVNKNWAEKGLTSLNISKDAVTQLNKAYLRYASEQHIYKINNPNFFRNSPHKEYTGRNKEFEAIMLVIGAGHGLHPGDRKFYYDPIYKRFKPIYYDGNSYITKLKDSLDGLMRFGNKLYFLRGNPGLHDDEIIGVKSALKSFNELDVKNFHDQIKELGLNYTLKEVEIIIDKIIENLKVMSTSTTKQIDSQYSPYFSHYKNTEPNKNLVFSTEKNLHIEICNLSLTSCYHDTLSVDKYAKLLQGRYSDNNNSAYIFIGNKQEYETGLIGKKDEKNKIFSINKGVQLITYGRPKVLISKENKTIELHQHSVDDRILIKGGQLKDWNIKFFGFINKEVSSAQRFNQNLLTGCLTLIDMSIDNINIEINQPSCEDGVNLMRVNGSVNNVVINNALSDAIDVDFSKLSFKNIKVDSAGNDCVDLSSGSYRIQNVDVTKCKDKAVSVGEKSELFVNFAKVSKSTSGIVAKDSSVVKVNTMTADDVTTCFSAYNKKQEFWGGRITINKHNCQSDQFFQENGSLVEFIQ